jgi:molybdate transport system substrate-binding protein
MRVGKDAFAEDVHVAGVTFVGPIPAELQPGFSFAGAVTTGERQPDAGPALLRFLASSEAASTIRKAGLTPP